MSTRVGRFVVAVACLTWLAACEVTSKGPNSLASLSDPAGDAAMADPTPTGSSPAGDFSGGSKASTPELLGSDPHDDLSLGKKYYRQGSYGIAERHFRKAVERHPRDAEAWVGLAASYDRLRRFDLADRAYTQAIRQLGATPEILNNQGFSYILRGDYRRARVTLNAARAKDPDNPYIQNNLRLLEESARKAKAVN